MGIKIAVFALLFIIAHQLTFSGCFFDKKIEIKIDLSFLFGSPSFRAVTLSYGYEDKTGMHELSRKDKFEDVKGFKMSVKADGQLTASLDPHLSSIFIDVFQPKKTWWVKLDGKLEDRELKLKIPSFCETGGYPCQIILMINGEPKDALECPSGSCSKYLYTEVQGPASLSIEIRANGPLYFPLVPSDR
ncbi:MAG: hypothetical protein N2513_10280 [Deltaproteobacteria bacterium]|nr:hypothetical protein [Deltaproteobacteria bacterium]